MTFVQMLVSTTNVMGISNGDSKLILTGSPCPFTVSDVDAEARSQGDLRGNACGIHI